MCLLTCPAEISDLPLDLQAILLKVLQEGDVVRVGSSKPVSVDVRIVAATNQDLKVLMDEGKFKADLYYRIATAVVQIPPIRERPTDIMMPEKAFLGDYGVIKGSVTKIHLAASRMPRRHTWPGNVRELQSAIRVACARTKAEGRKRIATRDLAN